MDKLFKDDYKQKSLELVLKYGDEKASRQIDVIIRRMIDSVPGAAEYILVAEHLLAKGAEISGITVTTESHNYLISCGIKEVSDSEYKIKNANPYISIAEEKHGEDTRRTITIFSAENAIKSNDNTHNHAIAEYSTSKIYGLGDKYSFGMSGVFQDNTRVFETCQLNPCGMCDFSDSENLNLKPVAYKFIENDPLAEPVTNLEEDDFVETQAIPENNA